MRHLILSDDGVTVAHNAYHRLIATTYFPENIRDQQQALFIGAIEQAEFDRVGEEKYTPSEIMRAASKIAERRTAQVYLTGFVALAYIWQKDFDLKPSLNRSAIIASCAANAFGKIVWRPGIDPHGKDRFTPVTSDPSSVEGIFRNYRSVAHICAGQIAASEYLAPTHLWDQTPEVTASIITNAAMYQAALAISTDTSRWNLWDVHAHFPRSLGDWPFLSPGDSVLSWIAYGYETAVSEGLIKKL
jgi:hypothetical protein